MNKMKVDFGEVIDLIRKEEVVLFVGAGFSLKAGAPSVKRVIECLINELTIEEKKILEGNNQLDFIANEFCQMRTRDVLLNTLERVFKFTPLDMEDHKSLSRIPHFKHIITTNYDSLIEDSYDEGRVHVIRRDEDCAVNHKDKVVVYKLHGDFSSRERIVITKNDYANFFRNVKGSPLWSVIESLFLKNNILFVGYSLEDENILDIISHINEAIGDNMRQMFLIAPNLPEYKIAKLNNLNVKYYQSKAEDFFVDLFKSLDANIHCDYKQKDVKLSTLAKYSKFHKLIPIASEMGERNSVHYKPIGECEYKINFDVDKEIAEKILRQDFSLCTEKFPKSLAPSIKLDKSYLKSLNMSINGMTVGDIEDYSTLYIAPRHIVKEISVRIPEYLFNEKIAVLVYVSNGKVCFNIDMHAFDLRLESNVISSEEKEWLKQWTVNISFKEYYRNNSEARKWVNVLKAIFENKEVRFSSIGSFQVDDKKAAREIGRIQEYYDNINIIESIYNVSFDKYCNYSLERLQNSILLIKSFNEEFIRVKCDEEECEFDLEGGVDDVKAYFSNNENGLMLAMSKKTEQNIIFCEKEFRLKTENVFFDKCRVDSYQAIGEKKVRVRAKICSDVMYVIYTDKDLNEIEKLENLKKLPII